MAPLGDVDFSYAGDWFSEVADDSIRQGDIYRAIHAFRLGDSLNADTSDPPPVARTETEITAIVLTPSCDLEQSRVNGVFLAAVWPATKEFLGDSKDREFLRKLEILRQGLVPARFLLPQYDSPNPPFPLSFVESRQRWFLPKAYLERHHNQKRLRLRHPFREQFGQWVGARASEVGPETVSTIKRFTSPGGTKDVLAAAESQEEVPAVSEDTVPGSEDETA